MSATDPKTETRSGDNYVPRDEAFSEVKNLQFSVTTLRSVLHAAVPAVQSTLIDPNLGFPSFFVIDKLFEDGVELPKAEQLGFLRSVVPRLLQVLRDGPGDQVLLFDTPANVQSTHTPRGSSLFNFIHSAHKNSIYEIFSNSHLFAT
jgi:lipoxygenase